MSDAGIFVKLGKKPDDSQLYEDINGYRKLEGMTWKSFVLISIAGRVAKDNPQLAQRIIDYVIK